MPGFQSLLRLKNLKLAGIMTKALVVGSAATVVFSTFAFAAPPLQDWTAKPPIHARPFATRDYVTGLTPQQVRTAYGIGSSLTGSNKTIAIVDAYGSSTIQNDLDVFSVKWGLPRPTASNFLIDPQKGAKATNSGWALETALDVEWAHAIAPNARIVLVVAKSASINDLLAAVRKANSYDPVAVSMSWGGGEFSSEGSYDSNFSHSFTIAGTTYNTTYFASSGDSGAGVEWPAVSQNVVGVGGTTLKLTNGIWGETAWSGSGGGISAFVHHKSYQPTSGSSDWRTVPDVAFNADPATGVAVYDSTRYNGQSGWFVVGGTSAGAPAWAGLSALGVPQGIAALYTLTPIYSYYNDITSGNNGPNYPDNYAVPGYDMVTGIGSPKVDSLTGP